MTLRWVCVLALLSTLACEGLWPKCQGSGDCPAGYACNGDGRCEQSGEEDAGVSSSSSAGASSTSLVSSSSAKESSSSAAVSSSSAAVSSSSSVDVRSSSAVTSSSSVEVSSSSAAASSSSSGPFCGAYGNTAHNRATPASFDQPFSTPLCRDNDNPEYFWRLPGSLRAGTLVSMGVNRLSLGDGGLPAYPVVYQVQSFPVGHLGQTVAACNAVATTPDSCHGALDYYSSEVLVRAALPLGGASSEPRYIQEATVSVHAVSACAAPPANTVPDQAAAFFLFWAGGAVCSSQDAYYWSVQCPQPQCSFTVEARDGPQVRTPLQVRAGMELDGGLQPCLLVADGTFLCDHVPSLPGSATFVVVRAPGDGGVLAESEYVGITVSPHAPPPDAGLPDAN